MSTLVRRLCLQITHASRLAFLVCGLGGTTIGAAHAQTLTGADPFHPRAFVRVYECQSEREGCEDRQTILERSGNTVTEYVNAEVDVHSAILITFDRSALATQSAELDREGVGEFEAAISITGRIGERRIEIPGYSIVGEQARTAVARVRSGRDLRSAFTSIRSTYGRVQWDRRILNFQQGDLDMPPSAIGEDSRISPLRADVAAAVAAAEQARYDLQVLLTRHSFSTENELGEFQGAQLADPASPSVTVELRNHGLPDTQALDALITQVAHLVADANRGERQAAELQQALDSLVTEDQGADNDRRREVEENRSSVLVARQNLLTQQMALIRLLDVILAPENGGLAQAFADLSSPPQNVGELLEAARAARVALAALTVTAPTTTEAYMETVATIRTIEAGIETLRDAIRRFDDAQGPEHLRARLIHELVDAVILLRQVDARPGDVVTIVIENAARTGGVPRTLTLRLTVREFGLVQQITDSFLFLRREGAEASELAEPDTDVSATDVPRDVDFEPTPGASLTWTYRPREDGNWLNGFMRFLQPGFGVNVSFPRFGTLDVETEEIGTEADPDTATTVVEDNGLDLAVGALVSLFDGAVMVTLGTPLTSRAEGRGSNFYWGLGFSFVNVAERLGR